MTPDFLLYHLSYIGIALLLSLSLTYIWRSNLFCLGHHGFFAIGAYTAVLVGKAAFPQDPSWFVGQWTHRAAGLGVLLISLLAGACSAGVVAAFVGRVFSSTRGDYFAVATLILAEVINRVISNWGYVGGAIGAEVPYTVLTNSASEHILYVAFYAALALALCGAVVLTALRMERSVAGLWLNAVRDDELAAESSGIDVKTLQLTVFTAGSAIAGMAGALFLHMTTLVAPSDFTFVAGIPTILYVVLGGLRPLRCVFATVLLYVLYQAIKAHGLSVIDQRLDQFASNWPEAIFGAILILSAILPISWQRWRGLGAA